MNRYEENVISLLVRIAKKKKLDKDQDETIKANKNQIKPKQKKPKLKAKEPVKALKQKNLCQKKKEMLTNQNGLALFVKRLGKRVKYI